MARNVTNQSAVTNPFAIAMAKFGLAREVLSPTQYAEQAVRTLPTLAVKAGEWASAHPNERGNPFRIALFLNTSVGTEAGKQLGNVQLTLVSALKALVSGEATEAQTALVAWAAESIRAGSSGSNTPKPASVAASHGEEDRPV